jgi:hypothetical protein
MDEIYSHNGNQENSLEKSDLHNVSISLINHVLTFLAEIVVLILFSFLPSLEDDIGIVEQIILLFVYLLPIFVSIAIFYNLILIIFDLNKFFQIITKSSPPLNKSEIKLLKKHLEFFITNPRLRKLGKNSFFEFWKPNLEELISEYFILPREVVQIKLDFEEKIFQITLFPVLIGATFAFFSLLNDLFSINSIQGFIIQINLIILFIILIIWIGYLMLVRLSLKRQIAHYLFTNIHYN